MNEIERVESYQIDKDNFTKEYLIDGQVRLRKNGEVLSLTAWNWEINRSHSMELKEKHPNALVRWLEAYRRRGFLGLIDAKRGEVVADVGAERGYFAADLVKRGCRVACLDIDPNLLGGARDSIGAQSAWYVASDIRRISVHSSTFDVTLAGQVLEHLPDPLQGLQELVRITRPGGRIFVSVPNEKLILAAKKTLRDLHLAMVLGRLSHNVAIGHLHLLGKKDLSNLCTQTDVVIESIYFHKPFHLNIFARLRKITT